MKKLRKALLSEKNTVWLTIFWLFILFPACVVGFALLFGSFPAEWGWVNDATRGTRTRGDLRMTLSLALGLATSVYLLGSMFGWAKRRRRPGGTEAEEVVCFHCGAENVIDYPRGPGNYEGGCGMILAVPLIASFFLYPAGRALEWLGFSLNGRGWILLAAWAALTILGFAIVRVLRMAPVDQYAIEENPQWKAHQKELDRIADSAQCVQCGKNPYGADAEN